jgi:hypothetical protein
MTPMKFHRRATITTARTKSMMFCSRLLILPDLPSILRDMAGMWAVPSDNPFHRRISAFRPKSESGLCADVDYVDDDE